MLSQAAAAGTAIALGSSAPGMAQAAPQQTAKPSGAPVYVVLWLDTEDYILPASDDAAKRIADILTSQGLRATFKIVGEKARVLEARRRFDVIAALSRHEIGYHSNTHSQQPTVAQYESVLDWAEGVEEFDRRERAGFDDLTRIFGYAPTCYGQPGNSWAPQSYRALRDWGVHVYLDDGQHLQIDGKPFWYGGLLNIFGIAAGRELEPNADWSNVEAAKQSFKATHAQLGAQPGGGLVSFMFHPTGFVSQTFWDAVNFSDGANPPASGWHPQIPLNPAESERAFHYLEDLVRHINSFPGVRFITASQAYALYRNAAAQSRSFAPQELIEIARRVNAEITFQVHDGYALAASEIFALLNAVVAQPVSSGPNARIVFADTPSGPSLDGNALASNPPARSHGVRFSRTAADVSQFLEMNGAIPSVVWLGSRATTPESYLLAWPRSPRSCWPTNQPRNH